MDKTAKSHHSFSITYRQELSRISGFIGFIALLVFVASLFSLPFPFSRVYWLKPALGVSGLINSGLWIWIAQKIKKGSLLAAFSGLGLIVYDQILTWSGFLFHIRKNQPVWQDGAYLAVSIAVSATLLLLIARMLPPIFAFTRTIPRRMYFSRHVVLTDKKYSLQLETLVLNIILYGALFSGAWYSPALSGVSQFSCFKILGEAVCVVAAGGIGQEISLFLEDLQPRILCAVKILTHLLLLAAFFCLLYQRLPFDFYLTKV